MGFGRQVGRVRFQHDALGGDRFQGFGQGRFFVGYRAVDAVVKSQSQRPFDRLSRTRKAVEHAAHFTRIGFQHFERLVPRFARVDHQRQLVFDGQSNLGFEQLLLDVQKVLVPMQIDARFADGHKRHGAFVQQLFHPLQMLLPLRVVVSRQRVKPHSGEAPFGVARTQVNEPLVFVVHGSRYHERLDSCRGRPVEDLSEVFVEPRVEQVGVRINHNSPGKYMKKFTKQNFSQNIFTFVAVMESIKELIPREVFGPFAELLRIPRPSKHEEAVRAYLLSFAAAHGLESQVDEKGNVVIRKAGVGDDPVVLQSHMDMVCEAASGSTHDFLSDPIDAYAADGWVRARGTTLGADCGIGMALQLAVLADKSLRHPPIEALFTVDEEQGLSGAMELGTEMLTGSRLLNLDSEDEGEFFIGCAGGVDTIATFSYTPTPQPIPAGREWFRVEVDGLTGGHSGDDIEKGRASANKLLAGLLQKLEGATLAAANGGNLRNAIARTAWAVVGVAPEKAAEAHALVAEAAETAREQFGAADPAMIWTMERVEAPQTVIETQTAGRLIEALCNVEHGVVAMSEAMPGLVETSTNLASIKMPAEGRIVVTTSQRSSVEAEKEAVAARVAAVFQKAGAEVVHTDGYPGWAPNPHSKLVDGAAALYKELFGTEPKIKAIHAGLECGLILEKYPQLDMVSFGPTIRNAHSPDERLDIASVDKTWHYLKALLERLVR